MKREVGTPIQKPIPSNRLEIVQSQNRIFGHRSPQYCRPNPSYKKQIRLTGSEFAQFFEGLNISGRILESVPNYKPRKKQLRFIPPYRKLDDTNGTRGINTR